MRKTYTVKQVAQALGFSTNTVYKYLEEGKIKATRLGKEGRFRIPEEEVVRLVGLKGENPQIAAQISVGEPTQPSSGGVELPSSFKEQKYNDSLSLLRKVSSPDLFDWFLSLTAIFLGTTYFLFPLHHQLIAFEPYRGWLMGLKLALIVLGVALMALDILIPVKKFHHHIFVRLPLGSAFAALAAIFYVTGEHWSASYFVSLGIFSLVPMFVEKRSFLKFIAFVYFLTIVSGWVWSKDPLPFFFVDIRDFIYANPGFFELLLTGGASIIFGAMLFTYYRAQTLLILLSWFIGGMFFLISISLINDGAWNKAVVSLMIGSFSLIFPFHKELDTLLKFSRKEILMSFSWLVLILIVGVSVIFYTQTTFKSFVLNESQKRVKTAANLVNTFAQDSIKYTTSFSQNPQLTKILSAKKINEEELDSFVKTGYDGATTLRRVFIFDENGDVLSLYPMGDPGLSKVNVSGREYFKQVKEQKRTVVSEFFESQALKGSYVIVVASPVIGLEGEIHGVVAGTIDISQIEDKLASGEFDPSVAFALADNKNTIFIHKEKEYVGQKLKTNTSLIKAVEGGSGQTQGYSDKGELSLQAYAPIPIVGWGIVAQQPISSAFRDSSLVSFTIFLVTIFSGVGALLVTMYLKRKQV